MGVLGLQPTPGRHLGAGIVPRLGLKQVTNSTLLTLAVLMPRPTPNIINRLVTVHQAHLNSVVVT